jgi:DNA polymerase III delta prime subunit
MELPFIQKYQPLNLKDFEIEPELYNVINIFININNLNLLFIGDSGTGKSSIISAIVREYYGDYYDTSNILYINSLKEQGISFYRTDVKTFCQTTSTIPHKKKIVILDDLDIINEQSQQVFRNCIDKYSNNVHFIASCYNTQKVIDSLQSRLNIIKFKSLKRENLQKIMEKIMISENIIIENDAKEFILSVSNNSIRILINYLEKLKLIPFIINKSLAIQTCTNINFNDFEIYTNYCLTNKLNDAIKTIYTMYDQGYSVIDILDNYFQFIKTTNILEENIKYKIIKLLCKYITIFHNIHEDEIELSLFTNNLIDTLITATYHSN